VCVIHADAATCAAATLGSIRPCARALVADVHGQITMMTRVERASGEACRIHFRFAPPHEDCGANEKRSNP